MMMNCSFGSYLRHTDIFQVRTCSLVCSFELVEKFSSLLVCLLYGFRSQIFFVCHPETEIYTNQWMEQDINKVLVAKDKDTGETHAYVGDDFDELRYELENYNYTTKEI